MGRSVVRTLDAWFDDRIVALDSVGIAVADPCRTDRERPAAAD